MEIVDAWGPSMLRLARQFTPSTRRRRGGRAGDLARRARRHRPLRGPLVAEDLGAADPRQPREDARRRASGARSRSPSLAGEEAGGDFHAVAADRFLHRGREVPAPLGSPAAALGGAARARARVRETLALIRDAIDELPPAQRTVILLRDVEGWDGPQVSNALDITETNQRVLLHRARSKVRAALEADFAPAT